MTNPELPCDCPYCASGILGPGALDKKEKALGTREEARADALAAWDRMAERAKAAPVNPKPRKKRRTRSEVQSDRMAQAERLQRIHDKAAPDWLKEEDPLWERIMREGAE